VQAYRGFESHPLRFGWNLLTSWRWASWRRGQIPPGRGPL